MQELSPSYHKDHPAGPRSTRAHRRIGPCALSPPALRSTRPTPRPCHFAVCRHRGPVLLLQTKLFRDHELNPDSGSSTRGFRATTTVDPHQPASPVHLFRHVAHSACSASLSTCPAL